MMPVKGAHELVRVDYGVNAQSEQSDIIELDTNITLSIEEDDLYENSSIASAILSGTEETELLAAISTLELTEVNYSECELNGTYAMLNEWRMNLTSDELYLIYVRITIPNYTIDGIPSSSAQPAVESELVIEQYIWVDNTILTEIYVDVFSLTTTEWFGVIEIILLCSLLAAVIIGFSMPRQH